MAEAARVQPIGAAVLQLHRRRQRPLQLRQLQRWTRCGRAAVTRLKEVVLECVRMAAARRMQAQDGQGDCLLAMTK